MSPFPFLSLPRRFLHPAAFAEPGEPLPAAAFFFCCCFISADHQYSCASSAEHPEKKELWESRNPALEKAFPVWGQGRRDFATRGGYEPAEGAGVALGAALPGSIPSWPGMAALTCAGRSSAHGDLLPAELKQKGLALGCNLGKEMLCTPPTPPCSAQKRRFPWIYLYFPRVLPPLPRIVLPFALMQPFVVVIAENRFEELIWLILIGFFSPLSQVRNISFPGVA